MQEIFVENKTHWHWFLEAKENDKFLLHWFWNDALEIKDSNEHSSDNDYDYISIEQVSVDKYHPELTVIYYPPDGYSKMPSITILTTANRVYGPIKFSGSVRGGSYEYVGV